ncbi:MAG TPA: VOC family protein [Pseudonocardiaceae bacterium]
MSAYLSQWTFDVRDVEVMARFWSEALGYSIDRGDDGNAKLRPPAGSPPSVPTIWLQATAGPKTTKNRCHPDLSVPGSTAEADARAEVDRLLALGATHADVGQTGDEGFVVLADPEGNEFCVLLRGAS